MEAVWINMSLDSEQLILRSLSHALQNLLQKQSPKSFQDERNKGAAQNYDWFPKEGQSDNLVSTDWQFYIFGRWQEARESQTESERDKETEREYMCVRESARGKERDWTGPL